MRENFDPACFLPPPCYSSPMPPAFTAGHSTRPVEELLALLAEHGVTTLVDVRRYPASRRHPQFSRDALAASLAGAGIQYVHEPDLGGRRSARPGSPHTAWRVEAFRGYADYMETPEFQAALDRLIRRSQGETVAILCAEAVPWRCHRRLISDALVSRWTPYHQKKNPRRADTHDNRPNQRLLTRRRTLHAAPDG